MQCFGQERRAAVMESRRELRWRQELMYTLMERRRAILRYLIDVGPHLDKVVKSELMRCLSRMCRRLKYIYIEHAG